MSKNIAKLFFTQQHDTLISCMATGIFAGFIISTLTGISDLVVDLLASNVIPGCGG